MSLETAIESLAAAINRLAASQEGSARPTAIPPIVAVQPTPTPAIAPQPAAVAPAPAPQPAATMPPLPTFAAPAAPAAPTGPAAPFTDNKGLMQYVMTSYQALGQTEGAKIQGVLTGLGYQNVNDIKAEHYGAFYAGVEALKGAK